MAEENAVALKLPTFWTSQPRVWLAQAEAQFVIRKITADDTKYYHVLSALDQDTATRLLDLISSPPPENKYHALKDRLVDTFGLSKRERASFLLHTRPLGDSKPSVLMDEMLALLGDHPPCMLFEQLFLERLPEDIRVQLVDIKVEDHRDLARKADALWAARGMGPSANAIRKPKNPPTGRKLKPEGQKDTLCYYHRRFGESAKQCRDPCTWSGNGQAGRP